MLRERDAGVDTSLWKVFNVDPSIYFFWRLAHLLADLSFPPGVLSVQSEKLTLVFLVALVCWSGGAFSQLRSVWKWLSFIFVFEGYFHWEQSSSWAVFFFSHFIDVLLPSGLHRFRWKFTCYLYHESLVFVSFFPLWLLFRFTTHPCFSAVWLWS